MGIWIRSQDKEKLCDSPYLTIVNRAIEHGFTEDGEINYKDIWVLKGGIESLGTYSTEEKALKVMDMIQLRLCSIYGITLMERMNSDDAIRNQREYLEVITDYVFQMPQDNEVEL